MRHCGNRHLIAGNADVCPWCGLDTQPGPPHGMTEVQGQALLSEAFRRNRAMEGSADKAKLVFAIMLALIAFCWLALLGSFIGIKRYELPRSACLVAHTARKWSE